MLEPMESVRERISLDHEAKAVLLGKPSALPPVYQLILAHESGEWQAAAELSVGLHLHAEQVAGYYWQAQQWVGEISTGGRLWLCFCCAWPTVQKPAGTGLALRGKDEYHKDVLIRHRSRESLLRQPIRGGALRIRYTENRS